MPNSAIIEVAIGLIFVYSLMSILVTQINTVIANFLNLRSQRLKEGLERLLQDPVVRAKIMSHPLISLVKTDVPTTDRLTSDTANQINATKPESISWIPSETFVAVLTNTLTASSAQKLYVPLNNAIDALPPSAEKSHIRELVRQMQVSGTGLQELRQAITALPDQTQQKSLLDALNLIEDALDKLGVESSDLIPLMIGIKQIQDPRLQNAMEAILNAASNLKDAQTKLQTWFDNGMSRATELFTKEMQRFSLAVGLLLALALNVDTIQLGRSLWEDPALRQAVVVAAQAAQPQLEAQISAAQPTPAPQSSTPEATVTPQPSTSSESQGTTTQDVIASAQEAQSTLQDLLNLRLPIGWEITPVTPVMIQSAKDSAGLVGNPLDNTRNLWNFLPWNNPGWLGLVLQKIIGLLVTMIAIAQGAPFWFDLLNRLTGKS
jgi:hypothetical protein